MKKLLILTGVLVIFVAYVVWRSTAYRSPEKVVQLITTLKEERCGNGNSRDLILLESKLSELRLLGDLEEKCNSQVTKTIVRHVVIPNNADIARSQAQSLADSMQEYKKYAIKPQLVVDISTSWKPQDFTNLANGKYADHLKLMFDILGNNGITQDDIDSFIIVPDPNLPLWSNKYIPPETFSKLYSQLAGTIKNYYPDVKKGVLFSASTYEEMPINWQDRDYRSLVSYVKGIDKGLIQVVGIEGYPWISPLEGNGTTIFEPQEYLPKQLIDELLYATESKEVIIGTNTFSAAYYSDPTKKIQIPADVRQIMLDKLLAYIKQYDLSKYNVRIVLSQPSTAYYPKYDWSYYGTDFTENDLHEKVLLIFLKHANTAGIGMILTL